MKLASAKADNEGHPSAVCIIEEGDPKER